MSAQEREAIIKLKTQNKAIRETAKPSGTFNLFVAELFPRLSKIASQNQTKSRTNSKKSLQKSTIKRLENGNTVSFQ